VAEYDQGGLLVDLCCASGEHLAGLAGARQDRSVGVDFSARYLERAREVASGHGSRRTTFVQGDARALPLASGSVSLLYSLSALYAIPDAEAAIAEIGRVLATGGTAILDLGNTRSLNVWCLRYYTEWPPIQPLTLSQIRHAVGRAGLQVVRHRRYQLLPLWADRPGWLRPLLHPKWAALLKRRWRGRMLDEWVSSLPLLRAFAFRHVIVCRKAG
jgi:ubiquinone/menaquinone biosynthesis C-methylase UbiE